MPDIFLSDSHIKTQQKTSSRMSPKKNEKVTKGFFNSLSSFWYRPEKVGFETKQKEEKIILLLRKHPITNIPWILAFSAMLFAPTLLGIFPILSFMPGRFQIVAVLGWYLITSAYAIEKFISWFFNVNIVTDERIIDIDFNSLIYKEVSDASLSKIQDITYRMLGFIRTVFNYGDVFIQTAVEKQMIEFHAVPKPAHVA